MTDSLPARLRTRADEISPTDTSAGPAVVQYGGVRIYGPDERTLHEGLRKVSEAILSVCGDQTSCEINPLLGICRRQLGFTINRKIFLACLGKEARMGNIEPVLCRSEHGWNYRVMVHRDNLPGFRALLVRTIDLARQITPIFVKIVRDNLYPSNEKGSWYQAQHLLQRLAYLGFVVQIDSGSFRIPTVVADAQTKANGELLPFEQERLV